MFRLINISLVLILFSSFSYANSTHLSSNERMNLADQRTNQLDQNFFAALKDSIREELSYYKNGNMRSRRRTFYDDFREVEFKTVYEKFRKSGSKLYVIVMDFPLILTYKAHYDPDGLIIVQKFYRYDREGSLVQIETRSDGVSTYQNFDTLIN